MVELEHPWLWVLSAPARSSNHREGRGRGELLFSAFLVSSRDAPLPDIRVRPNSGHCRPADVGASQPECRPWAIPRAWRTLRTCHARTGEARFPQAWRM